MVSTPTYERRRTVIRTCDIICAWAYVAALVGLIFAVSIIFE